MIIYDIATGDLTIELRSKA